VTLPKLESPEEPATAGVLRPAIGLLLLLTLVTGILYPLAVYALSNLLFPHQARGSLVVEQGLVLGSELIGQSFTDPRYFWGRPSATAPEPNNAAASTGSNLGPLHPALRQAIAERVAALHAADPENRRPVPVDLVTASASGIDPDISIAAARYQAPRVARLRDLPVATVERLIDDLASSAQFAVLGSPRINVLALNRALDRIERSRSSRQVPQQ